MNISSTTPKETVIDYKAFYLAFTDVSLYETIRKIGSKDCKGPDVSLSLVPGCYKFPSYIMAFRTDHEQLRST